MRKPKLGWLVLAILSFGVFTCGASSSSLAADANPMVFELQGDGINVVVSVSDRGKSNRFYGEILGLRKLFTLGAAQK